MSTILKALKKLEQDKQAFQAGGLPTGYMGPGSSHAHPSRGVKRFRAPLVRRSLVLLVVLCLAGASYFFYRNPQEDSPSTSKPTPDVAQKRPSGKAADPPRTQAAPTTAAKAESVPVVSVPQKQSNVGAQSLPPENTAMSPSRQGGSRTDTSSEQVLSRTPSESESRPEPPDFRRSSPDKRSRADVRAVSRPTPKASEPVASMDRAAPRDTKRVADKPVVPVTPPADEKPAPSPDDAYDGLSPLRNGRLKIQAIAWSPVQEDRMAVINTNIVHEGDKVDGFLVLRIRHDDVVVREKGVSYRVIFGRP